jgi:hypothetical protein
LEARVMSAILLKLSSVLGLSLASGINLYATVAVVGLITKFDLVKGLPAEFQAFNNDVIIAVALALYTCEFLADKIPAFDSFWDSVHTVVRPFGAALVAVTLVGDATPATEIIAGMVGASLGLATHTAKAGTRLAVNTSPEPFSNVVLSLAEDAGVVGLTVLVMTHPYISLFVSLVILGLLIRFGPGLWRGALLTLAAVPARIRTALATEGEPSLKEFLPDAFERAVDDTLAEGETVQAVQLCHARKVKGCGRNRRGYLVLTDRRLIFAFRKWFRTRTRAWEIAEVEKTGINPRLLVDVLRVKTGGQFLNFLFLKNRATQVARMADLLDESSADDGTAEAPVLGLVQPQAG